MDAVQAYVGELPTFIAIVRQSSKPEELTYVAPRVAPADVQRCLGVDPASTLQNFKAFHDGRPLPTPFAGRSQKLCKVVLSGDSSCAKVCGEFIAQIQEWTGLHTGRLVGTQMFAIASRTRSGV